MRALFCFANNRFIKLAEAGLPLTDLSVQRGYAIFDFLRISKNIPLFLDDHLERFFGSAQEMHLPVQQTKQALKEIITQLIEKNNLPDSGIRLMLSGGNSPDGYQIVAPSLMIVQQPIAPVSDQLFTKGYQLVSYAHQRQLPHVKTTDYLMAIWLQPWVKENGADDVLYHQNGMVSECPRSNFFIVTQEDTIITPARNILKGVTRKQILKVAAAQGMRVEEKDISIDDIRQAKEAFIGSSTKRIIPVVRVDDMVFEPVTENTVSTKLFTFLLQNEKEAMRVAIQSAVVAHA